MKKNVLLFNLFLILIINCFLAINILNINLNSVFAENEEEYVSNIESNNKIEVQHFFTHELLYDTDKAFSTKNSLRNCFDRDHLTCEEFRKILENLYENNYILVDIYDVYKYVDGKLSVKEGLDFDGKKPFVLSFDDLSYDTKGRGIVEKIVVLDGQIYDYASVEDKKFTQERDCLTILESFIKEHPDFSYNDARAILCVTGYNGAFGHRVFSDTYLKGDSLKEEEKSLSNLISLLKDKGYRFASHSYGHINNVFTNYDAFCKDVEKWKTEIGCFIGGTEIYCYPEGAHKCGTSNNEFLKNNGFKIFLCTGNFLTKNEKEDSATYFYRHPLDGKSLRNCEEEYINFFDVKKVYDKDRYVSFSYKENY